ncbi:endonuclease [Nonlabens marinus]|uniref:Chitinase n=1 Tax=Nonlabens marinus S1-08 TaxID=1454201 RepID=W8VR07_9FLAO|nr:endonuclease [Nonlabens marinus]BAO55370.1 chitinase [Nonlabens marinus S1-08]
MKLKLLTLLFFTTAIVFAQVPAYYNDVNTSLSGQALKAELSNKVTITQNVTLSYTPGVWDAMKQIDLDPTNTNNVILVYGYDDTDQDLTNDRTRNKNLNGGATTDWNREHVFPKSLGNPNLGTTGPGSDIHHLFPADVTRNASRSNRKFASGSGNSGITAQGYWYPGDEFKGDVARMMMFMYVRYGTRCLGSSVGVGNPVSTDTGMIDLFLQWNVEDPVSDFEVNRNELIEGIQGNRNPFIDNPAFATSIWNGPQAEDRFNSGSGTGGNTLCATTINNLPYAESFESGFGNWVQASSGDDFNWDRVSGSTPSSNTGPASASQGSNYLYMESSAPNYSSKRAILYGPCVDIPSSGASTFSFKYHMYGSTAMGSLSVEASLNGISWTSVWSRSGNQGNQWNSTIVDLDAYKGQIVQLRFNGLTGTTWQGDMAIDDLKILNVSTAKPSTYAINMRITFDNYPEETSWEIRNSNNQLATSGNNYGSFTPGSTINISKTLSDGCYTLIFKDAYGDGICCAYGNGSYTLTDTTNNTILASGGSFGASESTLFCLSNGKMTLVNESDNTTELDKSLVKLFPNPAKDDISITSSYPVSSYSILNTLGQRVANGILVDRKINVSELQSGVYFLQLHIENEVLVKRFIKE